jgi:hypothetical protein
MPFKQPIPRKIVPVNLYNPHAPVEDDKKKLVPGPGKYNVPSSFPAEDSDEPRILEQPGGRVYVDNNLDRFGQPTLPRKPKFVVPGPG